MPSFYRSIIVFSCSFSVFNWWWILLEICIVVQTTQRKIGPHQDFTHHLLLCLGRSIILLLIHQGKTITLHHGTIKFSNKNMGVFCQMEHITILKVLKTNRFFNHSQKLLIHIWCFRWIFKSKSAPTILFQSEGWVSFRIGSIQWNQLSLSQRDKL